MMQGTNGRRAINRYSLQAAALTLLSASGLTSSAQASTWTQISGGDASGSWANAANWNSGAGPVAGGTADTADFATLDVTLSSAVTLDSDVTIGGLKFGDTASATSANWSITPGTPAGALTLSGATGVPVVQVLASTATISAPLKGTQGFQKTGAGTLLLNSATTLSGGITVSGGILSAENPASLADNSITLSGGGLSLRSTGNWGNDLELTANATLEGPFGTGAAINLGTLRLGHQLTVYSLSGVNNPRHDFNQTILKGNSTIVMRTDGTSLNQSSPMVELGTVTVDPGTVAAGSTTTLSFSRSAGVSRIRVAQVSGAISDGAGGRVVGVTLVNSSNSVPGLVLKGNNTYTGATQVLGGALALNGATLATSNISIENNGKLGGGGLSNSSNTFVFTGGSNGTIRYLVDGSASDAIQISGNAQLLLEKLILDVSMIDPTLSEYVIANKAVGGANIVGSAFAATLGAGFASGDWTIDYDGTAANPGSIVLVVPEPTGMVLGGLTLAGLLARRRRS